MMERIDKRYARAKQFTAMVMQIVGKYITNKEDDFLGRANNDLMKTFYEAGVEISTDFSRQAEGKEPRDRLGWTATELVEFQARLHELNTRPITVVLPLNRDD